LVKGNLQISTGLVGFPEMQEIQECRGRSPLPGRGVSPLKTPPSSRRRRRAKQAFEVNQKALAELSKGQR
jgi:hypothetical protein